jgi:hypothetical protein
MALYNRDLKFIYLAEPHTASRATFDAIEKSLPGTAKIGHHHISIAEMTNWRRVHLRQTDVVKCTVVTNVRNPLDTVVTRWKHGPFKDVSFWRVLTEHQNNVSISDPGMGLYREAEFFCWYEALELDLQWMFNRDGLRLQRNPEHITEGKHPWQEYYRGQRELVDTMVELYKAYLDKFGYQIGWDEDEDIPTCKLDLNIRAALCPKIL